MPLEELPDDVLAEVRAAFADAFVLKAGIDPGWLAEVRSELRVRPMRNSLFFVFSGANGERRWDRSPQGAVEAALSTVDHFVSLWRTRSHERGPHRWDIAPGTQREHGCRCESVDEYLGDDAVAYVRDHLMLRRQEGTLQEGRALYLCPYLWLRWEYAWDASRRGLVRLDDPT